MPVTLTRAARASSTACQPLNAGSSARVGVDDRSGYASWIGLVEDRPETAMATRSTPWRRRGVDHVVRVGEAYEVAPKLGPFNQLGRYPAATARFQRLAAATATPPRSAAEGRRRGGPGVIVPPPPTPALRPPRPQASAVPAPTNGVETARSGIEPRRAGFRGASPLRWTGAARQTSTRRSRRVRRIWWADSRASPRASADRRLGDRSVRHVLTGRGCASVVGLDGRRFGEYVRNVRQEPSGLHVLLRHPDRLRHGTAVIVKLLRALDLPEDCGESAGAVPTWPEGCSRSSWCCSSGSDTPATPRRASTWAWSAPPPRGGAVCSPPRSAASCRAAGRSAGQRR